MTELPDDLRALLNLTRDAHDPSDPEARTRVRHAVAASLLSSGGAAGGSVFPAAASNTQTLGALAKTAKASKFGWVLFGGKVSTVALGAVMAAGLTFAAYSFTQQPVSTPKAALASRQTAQLAAPPVTTAIAPVLVPAPAVEPAVASTTPDQAPGTQQTRPVRSGGVQPSAATLSAEMGLLRSASDALARGDETAALAHLREHGRRFPNGSLREERDGLRAIAECTRDDAPSNASAKRFLRQYPSSLLGARIAKACAGR